MLNGSGEIYAEYKTENSSQEEHQEKPQPSPRESALSLTCPRRHALRRGGRAPKPHVANGNEIRERQA